MKKILYIAFFLISVTAFSQRGGKMQQRIKAQKIAFITERLQLSSEEAQKFWPIYNAFEAITEKIKSEDLRAFRQKMNQNTEISEDEADKLLEKLIKAEDKMYQAKIDLITNLKGVISSKKIIILKRTEEDFHRKLLGKLRHMREKKEKKN